MQNIKHGLEGHAVDWYHEVFDLVFPDVDAEKVNGLWKEHLKEPGKKKQQQKEKDADADEDVD